MSCWASSLGDCGGGISREHIISASQFDEETITLQCLPWCKEPKTIGLASLVAKNLCRDHNTALSPVDEEARNKCVDGDPSLGFLFTEAELPKLSLWVARFLFYCPLGLINEAEWRDLRFEYVRIRTAEPALPDVPLQKGSEVPRIRRTGADPGENPRRS